jgi:RNA polymerase sigma factor (sigma-70 family)
MCASQRTVCDAAHQEVVVLLKELEKNSGRELENEFRIAYEKYRSAVFGLIKRRVPDHEIARDLVQEVFVRVFRDFDRFDPEKGSLFTWIRALAFQELGHYFQRTQAEKRNASVISMEEASGSIQNVSRGRNRNPAHDPVQDDTAWEVADSRFDPVQQWESDEAYREFLEAMEHLSPELQDYVLHYYFYNRTRKQLAQKYGVAEATVMRRISAAKTALRQYLEKL